MNYYKFSKNMLSQQDQKMNSSDGATTAKLPMSLSKM